MLQPKKVKHRKMFKGRNRGKSHRGNRVSFGDFGLQSTAAGFLAAFAGKGPWAHLDIAGTAWGKKSDGYNVPGATGVGVRTLLTWLQARG